MTAPYLATLNPEQRRAVEHGVASPSPLLIIAGAGSGKTNTLAHRVAHLIVEGADSRRMMLLTFSRRAAVEMSRRVERIAVHVLPDHARLMVDALTWSGTFHAIGARLLREYAEQIGLDRAFTIHDREDSSDLMNLVRHDLGYSKTEERFPAKNTCLAIYSRTVNAETPLSGDPVMSGFDAYRARIQFRAAGTVRASQANGIIVRESSQWEFFNTIGGKADMDHWLL
jgi:DNA helicase II / ATP-dependent DNA helicase PcrA